MAATILMYSVPSELHKRLEEVVRPAGFACKKIAKKRFLQPIGCHAGLPGFEQTADWYEGKELPDPVLVFSGFRNHELDRFLALCKEQKLTEFRFRAVMTKHNMYWNVLDLYRELVQEYESLHP